MSTACAPRAPRFLRNPADDERRRAVPSSELRPLPGAAQRREPQAWGGHERRRAVPSSELRPLRGQRSGESRKGGGAMTHPQLSVVIPVFNEEAGLPALFARLYPALDELGAPYEV